MILAKIASPSRSVDCEVHGMSSPRTCTAPHLSVTTSGVAIHPAPSWQGRVARKEEYGTTGLVGCCRTLLSKHFGASPMDPEATASARW